jgi:hypothetical protein
MALTLARAEADLAACVTGQSEIIQDLASRYCAESVIVIERAFESSTSGDTATAGRLRECRNVGRG